MIVVINLFSTLLNVMVTPCCLSILACTGLQSTKQRHTLLPGETFLVIVSRFI